MGADRSFEAFYRAQCGPVVRSLTLTLGDRGLAEDAAQVAFERAYARWSRISSMHRPGTWVYVVALRQGWRQASRSGRGVRLAARDQGPGSDDTAARSVSDVNLVELLARLPRRQREAVVLRHVADLPLAEIAAIQGIAVGTVKATLHAAYARLRVEAAAPEEVIDRAP